MLYFFGYVKSDKNPESQTAFFEYPYDAEMEKTSGGYKQ